MDYKQLHKHLQKPPLPNGWKVIGDVNTKKGGVYFLPNELKCVMQPNEESISRLGTYPMLFEFHVTENNKARILARGRLDVLDSRWLGWWNLARVCGADKPQDTPHKTMSVARWKDGVLEKIKYETSASKAAKIIRKYLEKPDKSLDDFVEKLGAANLDAKTNTKKNKK